jgi:hypothetical protein
MEKPSHADEHDLLDRALAMGLPAGDQSAPRVSRAHRDQGEYVREVLAARFCLSLNGGRRTGSRAIIAAWLRRPQP